MGQRQHRDVRRRHGVFYTPDWLADQLAAAVLDGFSECPRCILDPSCGDGALLRGAWRYGRARGWSPEAVLAALHGCDIDGEAVALARSTLGRLAIEAGVDHAQVDPCVDVQLRVGDGLTEPFGTVDAILTNPPFGNAIEAATARDEQTRTRHRQLAPEVAVGAYDRAVVFAAVALDRLRDGGRYGIILPRSALGVSGGSGFRARFDELAAPEALLAPTSARLFEAADVFVTGLVGQRGRRAERVRIIGDRTREVPRTWAEASWSELLDPTLGLLRRVEAQLVRVTPLAERFEVRSGATTAVAYELSPHVTQRGAGLRLMTTGLIDRYASLWAERRCRYLGQDYRRPRWPQDGPVRVLRAQERQRQPKVLLAGLSKVLEAVADLDGSLGGVVSTWTVTPARNTPDRLRLTEALLNAPVLALLYAIRNRGKELSGRSITVGKRELTALPVPSDLNDLDLNAPPLATGENPFDLDPATPRDRAILAATAVTAVQRDGWAAPNTDNDIRAARAIARLYGLDEATSDAVESWFCSRCPRS